MDERAIEAAIQRVGKAIEDSGKSFLFNYKARQRIDLKNKNNIYFLKSGSVAAHSYNEKILTCNILVPEVIGIESLRGMGMFKFLRCITDVELVAISNTDAVELFTALNIWRDVNDCCLSLLNVYLRKEHKFNQSTSRGTIIEYMKHIWTLSPSQRNSTSIYTFILARTHISRSLIHKVVSALEDEGLIIVRRGILVKCKL